MEHVGKKGPLVLDSKIFAHNPNIKPEDKFRDYHSTPSDEIITMEHILKMFQGMKQQFMDMEKIEKPEYCYVEMITPFSPPVHYIKWK